MSGRLFVLVAMIVSPLGAQSAQGSSSVPEGFRPPPGMCRIWINGVPADRQPAPTDCATAVRRRPANAKVVFGDQPTANVSTSTSSAPAPANASSAASSAAPLSVHETAAPEVKPDAKNDARPATVLGGGPTPSAGFSTGGAPPSFIVHTAPRPAVHTVSSQPVVHQPAPASHGGQHTAPNKSTAAPPAHPTPRGH